MGSSRGDALRMKGVLQASKLMEVLVDAKVEFGGCLRWVLFVKRTKSKSVEEAEEE